MVTQLFSVLGVFQNQWTHNFQSVQCRDCYFLGGSSMTTRYFCSTFPGYVVVDEWTSPRNQIWKFLPSQGWEREFLGVDVKRLFVIHEQCSKSLVWFHSTACPLEPLSHVQRLLVDCWLVFHYWFWCFSAISDIRKPYCYYYMFIWNTPFWDDLQFLVMSPLFTSNGSCTT